MSTAAVLAPAKPNPLAPLWARLAALQQRFDARQPRERLLMIVVAVVGLMAVMDLAFVGPAFDRLKASRQQHHQALRTQQQLQTDSLQVSSARETQSHSRRNELDAWRSRTQAGEARLRAHEDALISPDQMMALVEQVLARHGQVRVKTMRLLERVDLLAPAAATTGNATPAGKAAAGSAVPLLAGASLYRHGMELVLEGSFADLLAYMKALEAMPQNLLWGAMSMQVQQHPQVQLSLRLYTISRDRHGLAF
jgi:MSHA biogenesis protein MshJ